MILLRLSLTPVAMMHIIAKPLPSGCSRQKLSYRIPLVDRHTSMKARSGGDANRLG